jgi:nucleoside-diphosphate-sugar epimerase
VITRIQLKSESVRQIRVANTESSPSHAVSEFNPEIVIHLATRFQASHSTADINELISSNIEFGTNRLESAKSGGAVFVYVNSAWQHFESKTYSLVSLHAATKQALADTAQYYGETGLELRSLTIYNAYGPTGQRNKLIRQLLNAANGNEQIDMGQCDQFINMPFLSDVVPAIIVTAVFPAAPVIQGYVARAQKPISIRELVTLIEQATGKEVSTNWGACEARTREVESDWVFGELLPTWNQQVDLAEGLRLCWQEVNSGT